MINYMLEFIQNNFVIITVLLTITVLFSIAYKIVRRIMYVGLGAGAISLILAILHKFGYELDTFYLYFQRTIYSTTRFLECMQNALMSNKFVINFTVSLIENNMLFKAFTLYRKFYMISFMVLLNNLVMFINEIIIRAKEVFNNIKEIIVKKINRPSLKFVYRL